MSTLREEFQDAEYRRAYAESFANTVIATQIRLLRGSMTQAQFAALVGMKQSRISAMEDENYSSWSTKTLKQVAAAKDVVFLGRFVSFGELLNWSKTMSDTILAVPSFAEDPAFAGVAVGMSSQSATTMTLKMFDVVAQLTTVTVPMEDQTVSVHTRPLSQLELPMIKLVQPQNVAA